MPLCDNLTPQVSNIKLKMSEATIFYQIVVPLPHLLPFPLPHKIHATERPFGALRVRALRVCALGTLRVNLPR
jgi:hypothetical protein